MTYLRLLLLAALLAAVTACGSVQTQAMLADQLAAAANVASVELRETYRLEGHALLDEAADRGLSRAEAHALIEAWDARWKPLDAAQRAFAAVHDEWATYLEGGQSAPAAILAAAVRVWCRVRDAAAELGHDMPALVPCEVTP